MKIVQVLAAFIVVFGVGDTLAQGYPTKPVRMVLPFTPGSGTDILARAVCPRLSELWGQQVLVDNRTGAGGTIAASIVAKAPATGYTLFWHSNAFATNPAVYGSLPYDPLKDFVAIAPLLSQPMALVVSPVSGMRSIGDLIAAAKARPGQITFASAGIGSGTHFTAEKFRIAAGIDVVHVPYKGGPEANTDVMTGRVTYWFAVESIALPYVREGRLLALGMSGARRSNLMPEVPTIAEAGVPEFNYTLWWGLWAPAGIPTGLVDKISKDVARTLSAADLRERLAKLGAEPMARMTPAEFARFVRNEIEDSARIVKVAGIKAN